MSAGFFITAKNKLGIHIQSGDSESESDESDNETYEQRRRRLARKPDPLISVLQHSKNERNSLPNACNQLDSQTLAPITEVKHNINWNYFIPDAKGIGMVSKYTPPNSAEREADYKLRSEASYKFNLKPSNKPITSLTDQEYSLLHDGMVKGKNYQDRDIKTGKSGWSFKSKRKRYSKEPYATRKTKNENKPEKESKAKEESTQNPSEEAHPNDSIVREIPREMLNQGTLPEETPEKKTLKIREIEHEIDENLPSLEDLLAPAE